MLRLPYTCPIDHWLDPARLASSPYTHRERSFFLNQRTPKRLWQERVLVHVCGGTAQACNRSSANDTIGGTRSSVGGSHKVVRLPASPSIGALRSALGDVNASVIHLDDVR